MAVGLGVVWLVLAALGLVIFGDNLRHPRFPRLSGFFFSALALVLAGDSLLPIVLPDVPGNLTTALKLSVMVVALCLAASVLFEFFLSIHGRDRRSLMGVGPDQDRLRFAMDAASNGLWVWNIKDDTVWFSTTFKELLGFEEDEFPNNFNAWEERLHKDDHTATIKALERHVKEGSEYDVIYRLKRKDGAYHWFRARGRAERNAQGNAIRMAGSIQDVNQQQNDRQRLLKVHGRPRRVWLV